MKSRFINSAVCGLAVTALLGLGVTSVARADGHKSLKQELRMLNERMQELEAKLAETEEKVAETHDRAILSTGKSPGSFLIPGTDTEFRISGYVNANFAYDLKQKQRADIDALGLELTPDDDQGQFHFYAKDSRLRVNTSTPTPLGDLKTFIETDFYGEGNTLRLRHAFVEIGGLLAGQYWTNFGTLAAYPGTVAGGTAGSTYVRQAQVRWTQMIDDKLKFAVSLEDPNANPNFASKFLDRLPDAVVALEYNDDWGQLRLSALGRQLTTADDMKNAMAYGISVGGAFAAWPGGNILASFTYGDGIGRYLDYGEREGAFYGMMPGSTAMVLETKKALGIMLGVNHKFTDTVMGQISLGRGEIKDAQRLRAGFKRLNTVHTSLFWTPLSRLTIGGEVAYYDKEIYTGEKIENIRLQTSVKVTF